MSDARPGWKEISSEVFSGKALFWASLFALFTLVAGILHVRERFSRPLPPAPWVPAEFDPRLIRLDAMELAMVPLAPVFESPMGSASGAFIYDAQPYFSLNTLRGGRHLAADLNGIGGWNSDLGDPVRASGNGLVVYSGEAGRGWGEVILLAHRIPAATGEEQPIALSLYAHLEKRDVVVGQIVYRGDIIGQVGNAGGLYLAHLHYEIRDMRVPHPSFGYTDGPGKAASGRIDPGIWLRDHAPAQADLLMPSVKPTPTIFRFPTGEETPPDEGAEKESESSEDEDSP